MARREVTLTIEADGRDQGKQFFIRELPAMKVEKWAARALLAMSRSGMDIPPEIASAGLAGLAAFGIHALSGVQFAEAEPLMDEMLYGCVTYIPDPNRPTVKRALIEDDVEELKTLFQIRAELLRIHTGFSMPVFNRNMISA